MEAEQLEDIEQLALRAVACKHWRWMPGMLGLSIRSSSRSIWIRIVDPPNDDTTECWPDLTDPATLGCLLHLVREAWQEEDCASYRHATNKWRVEIGTRAFTSDSEAAALVAALEAAP